jgi:hypothetical protein
VKLITDPAIIPDETATDCSPSMSAVIFFSFAAEDSCLANGQLREQTYSPCLLPLKGAREVKESAPWKQ